MLKHRYSRDRSLNGSRQTSSFDLSEDELTVSSMQPEMLQSSSSSASISICRQFPISTENSVAVRLRALAESNEIPDDLSTRLHLLAHFNLIIVCDDSGSMNTPVDGGVHTRWDELKGFVEMILQVATIFHRDGINIHFLNRKPLLNVKDPQTVREAFAVRPRGFTPLVKTLRKIFQEQKTRGADGRKTLVFIATDGAPTDEQGEVKIPELEHLMNSEREVKKIHVSFLICTDDQTCVDYLNGWDKTMINVDVTDDFRTEREQVRQARGKEFSFSKGEYLVKALIGAIDPEIDGMNEADF